MLAILDRLRGLWLRARYYLFRSRYDREMEEEMRFHLDLRAAEHRRDGADDTDARDAARREFGNATVLQEARRRAVGFPSLDTLGQDLRYVVRALGHSPGFSLMVVLTLGLGIGANAAMFGIIDRLLLSGPAHVVDANRVVRLYATTRARSGDDATESTVGYVTYAAIRDHTHAFERVAAYATTEETARHGVEAERITIGRASWDFFPLLGVRPVVGRFFGPDEDRQPRGEHVIVLDEGYWGRAFGSDRAVIGRTMQLGSTPYTIIGVAPQGFTGAELERRDAWVPISIPSWGPGDDWATTWDASWLQVIGRLKPGVTPAEAGIDATAAHRGTYDGPPNDAMRAARFSVAPLHFTRRGTESTEAAVARWLVAVSVIVLLIACANVANLFLARALRRRREIAVRLALGIGRARLVRLLLAESVVLAVIGGIAGVAIAAAGGGYVRGALLPDVAWWGSPVNGAVLALAAVAAVLTGVLVGLVPALQSSRPDLTRALKAGARAGGQRSRLRTALTVAQAALSVILLIGAGLFVRSLWHVRGLDLGIQPDRVLVIWFSWPSVGDVGDDAGARERARRNAAYDRALDRMRQMPGVERAAVVVGTPFQMGFAIDLRVDGRDSFPERPFVIAASSDYFVTAGTKVVRGRVFTAGDRGGSERVAVVNETMARTLWPNGNAIGQCLYLLDTLPCSRVIGVVQDVHRFRLREDPAMQYYVPFGQQRSLGFGGSQLLVRPRGDPMALAGTIRKQLAALEPGATFISVKTLQATVDPQVRPWKLGATMFGIFGLLALLVAAIGLYSVIAYLVSQRTHEMGVRVALGARGIHIVGLILGYGLGTAALGLAIGVVAALFGGRWIAPLLFETSPHNPAVFAVVVATLMVVAIVASLVPAWRATRIDPIEALRSE